MNELNLNIFNILIISGVLHGIIFSAIVFITKKYREANTFYLGLVVLFLSLSNFQYWLIDTNLIQEYPKLKFIYIPWQWLVLPMFYLYVYNFIGRKEINRRRKILLLGPFISLCFLQVFLLIYKFFVNQHFIFPTHFQRGVYIYLDFLSVIFNLLVMYITYKMIIVQERDKSYDIEWVKSETNWLKSLIYIGFFICFCWVIAISIVALFELNNSHLFYPMWIGISILVYWIGYVGITKSNQLESRIQLRRKRISDLETKANTVIDTPTTFQRMMTSIELKKYYLNPDISLEILSKKLKLSEGYISQLFTKNSKQNFNDYINSLRVEEAKSMLQNAEYDNYTIISIGLESGFNSKSSFYHSFKKNCGMTPMEFKKYIRKT